MTEQDDADALAARYFDLWQQQLGVLLADPAAAQNLMTLMGMFGMGMFGSAHPPHGATVDGAASAPSSIQDVMAKTFAGMMPTATRQADTGGGTDERTDRPQTGGAASELDTAVLVELLRRVSRLEERLDTLVAARGPGATDGDGAARDKKSGGAPQS